jgi:hypothetical protein
LIAAQQRPQFRTFTDVVTVDVSVLRGNQPVPGLKAADFQLTDNGVAQTIEALEMTAVPLDVTVAVDTSGSMATMLEPVRSYMQKAVALLKPGDRMRLISFSDAVSQLSPFTPVGPGFTVPPLAEGGGTSMYDGLVAALVPPREGDRRHLVVAFTDGIDTMSVLNSESLLEVGRRSDSVLHLFLVTVSLVTPPPPPTLEPRLNSRQRWAPTALEDAFFALRDTARDTGGLFQRLYDSPSMPDALRRAIEAFRASYVLRYRATGVPREGWHAIEVTLTKRAPYEVRARRGYFGS